MPAEWETIACPDCKGRGKLGAFVDGPNFAGHTQVPCSRCKGQGMVVPIMEQWMRVGGVHRTWRVAQHESLMACAARLGISVPHLSDMEHGRIDSAPLIADTPEVLRNAS